MMDDNDFMLVLITNNRSIVTNDQHLVNAAHQQKQNLVVWLHRMARLEVKHQHIYIYIKLL